MKIKHFSGYGNVDAKKISCKRILDFGWEEVGIEVKIRVRGNHERGLAREWDTYGVADWLLCKHFMKGLDIRRVESMTCNDFYEKVGNIDEEVCDYTFIIKNRE